MTGEAGIPAATAEFQLGPWRVTPLTFRLATSRQVVKLEPKAMAVLVQLAAQAPQVVSREALMEQVWPDVVVGEEALNNAISKLRRTLGDTVRQPQYIETVPKAGYRLLVVPEAVSQERQLTQPLPPLSRSWFRWPWMFATLMLGIGILLAGYYWYQHRTPAVTSGGRSYAKPEFLTTFPGIENNPVLNGDGSLVAFSWQGPNKDNWDIYVTERGREPRRLTDDPHMDGSPTFSPDGRSLAFQRFSPDQRAIFTVPVDGGPSRLLADCGLSIYPDVTWSPDGRFLAFSGRVQQDDRSGITLLSLDSLIQRRITDPEGFLWGDHDPAFSPDGATVAFIRSKSEGVQDLYIVKVDGTDERRLTEDGRNVVGLTWEADSRHLVFSADHGGVLSLWRLDINQPQPQPLPMHAWFVSKPHLSRDGQVLAFEQTAIETNIWAFDTNTGQERHLLGSTRWDMHPDLSRDGSELVFASNRSGNYEVWLANGQGGEATKLTQFGGPFTGTPRFSPDGWRIAFDSRPEGNADIYQVLRTGGPPIRLTHDPADDLAPSWSSDGKRIYFASARTGRWQVHRIDAAGGQPVQITEEGGYAAREDSDGKFLYFTRFEGPGLWRKDLKSGGVVQVLEDLKSTDWGNWTITDRGLIFARRAPGQKVKLVLKPWSEEAELVLHEITGLPGRDPALTANPAGTVLYFGRVDRAETDIMLVPSYPMLLGTQLSSGM